MTSAIVRQLLGPETPGRARGAPLALDAPSPSLTRCIGQRSNYSEPSTLVGAAEDAEEGGGGRTGKGRARQALSDKRAAELGKKKKSTMNVRTAVLYKKSFAQLLEESGIASYPAPTYITATAPPPREPPRMMCTVCGYYGKYRCMKCGVAYCDKNCESVHEETRCERRVA